MNWKRLLAYITGSVDNELLLQNEYLVTENRILKNQIKGRLQLTDAERISLAEIGKRLGRMALAEAAQIVRTRDDSCVAPEVGGKKVRRFKEANDCWPCRDGADDRGVGTPV